MRKECDKEEQMRYKCGSLKQRKEGVKKKEK
jgi:hypothetical protein